MPSQTSTEISKEQKAQLIKAQQGELDAVKGYAPLVADFPKIAKIISDEALHADLIKNMS